MKRVLGAFCGLIPAMLLMGDSDVYAQCSTNMLVALDEERQSFNITVRTQDVHCLASGEIRLTSNPPGAVTFLTPVFQWDPILSCVREGPDGQAEAFPGHCVRESPITAVNMPPGMPFQLRASATYDDPWYPPQMKEETVWVNPANGRLEIYHLQPCTDNVPPMMAHGSFCFVVCHKVYRIRLLTMPWEGRPIIQVSPGCPLSGSCPALPCTPGNPWDYIHFVYYENGSWWLYFEYSNQLNEPACYCVTWNRSSPRECVAHELGAWNEVTQTFDVHTWVDGACPAGYQLELFSYPPGALIREPVSDHCAPLGDSVLNTRIPVSAGAFTAGNEFQLVAYFRYDTLCPFLPPEYEPKLLIETVRVLPGGGLEHVSTGNCQAAGGDHVPTSMSFGQSECFVVCHRHYYVLLETPPNATPVVSVTPGCDPPCAHPGACTPGNPAYYWYAVERWGNQYFLHFEYSNEHIEPVCYCVHYDNLLYHSSDIYRLAVLDEERQTLDVSLWMTGPGTMSGTMEIRESPTGIVIGPYNTIVPPTPEGVMIRESPTLSVGTLPPGTSGFFDIFLEMTVGGEPRQEHIIETFMVDTDGLLRRWDPVQPCMDNVPPQMNSGQSACFQVCHRVYDVLLNVPPGAGQPLIEVVPGCHAHPDPQCNQAPFCEPGHPGDYVYRTYRDPFGFWHLEFEYSNMIREPVCYCVTVVAQPPPCEPHQVVVLDDFMQTLDITFWITSPIGLPCMASGFINIFSVPPGAYIGPYISQFSVSDTERVTLQVPVSSGLFPPGSNFDLVVAFDFVDPPYPDYSVSEPVLVTSTGSLVDTNLGMECSGSSVPREMGFGNFNCFTVCHGTYYVQLNAADDQIPQVHVWPGCDSLCWSPQPCTPGAPDAYTASVKKIGSQWYLIFQYGGAAQPVCYCVHYWGVLFMPPHPLVLSSVNETALPARDPGTLNVSLRSTSPFNPVSGRMSIRSHPPGAMIGPYTESFFDIFTEFYNQEVPVGPGIFLPGQTFQLITEVVADQPVPTRTLYNEWAIVGPMGDLRVWDQVTPCTGDVVPQVMNVHDSHCFVVCHGVYRVLLTTPPGAGQPILDILPGCEHPRCQPAPVCRPGDPRDYCYRLIPGDPDWILEFEYSNEFIQPVCYCVTYVGNLPDHCVTHELAALDELYQTFDVSTMVRGDAAGICVANGWITAFSNPPGAEINPGSILFENVHEDWHTMEFAVGPGAFLPGSVFQLIARVDYVDPPYPDRWLIETVRVVAGDPVRLAIEDIGGECTGENVPEFMFPGQSACFEVCHRVYHVPLGWFYPTVPQVVITPGCYGPEVDACPPHPDCLPGGILDYVAQVRFDEGTWLLDFEYSNPNREPVCYCVTLVAPPCLPPDSLVIFYEFSELSLPQLHFYWHAPQFGHYRIFSTPMPNHSTIPPSPEWTEETVIVGGPGQLHWSRPFLDPDPGAQGYRNFVIICECGPWSSGPPESE